MSPEPEKKWVKREPPKEEKQETSVIPEKKEFVQAEKIAERQNLVIHSELDAFLIDRAKSQPKTLEEIDTEIVSKPKDGRHALSLPTEIEPYMKKYAFCWIFKRKQAIDEACDLLHYKFANRSLFSELPDHLFSARGIIERGDNVLMFRPKSIDEELRKAPGIESNERIAARMKAHEGDPDFYIPKPEEGESRVVGV